MLVGDTQTHLHSPSGLAATICFNAIKSISQTIKGNMLLLCRYSQLPANRIVMIKVGAEHGGDAEPCV